MITLEFHDPSGTIEVARSHAPRLASLDHKRIGILSNEHWQAHRMLPLVSQLISQEFAGTQVLPVDAFPQGNTQIGTETTAMLVARSGVDAVIIGNAA